MNKKPLSVTYYLITAGAIFLQSFLLYYLYSRVEMSFKSQLLVALLIGVVIAGIVIGASRLLRSQDK